MEIKITRHPILSSVKVNRMAGFLFCLISDQSFRREQIKNADTHDGNGSDLRLHPVGYDTHEEREDRSSKQSHDHQAGYFVLAVRQMEQGA